MRDYETVLKQARTCANRKYCDIGGNCEYYDAGVCCQGCEKDIFKDAADAIEELLVAVPKWISVQERLPHYLDHVLCVNKYGIQMVGHLTDYKESGFRCESGMDSCDYITHWMPLPVPPKEVV